jgi:hypothetical protein
MRNRQHAVSVGIGFDDSHNLGARSGGTNDLKVVLQRAESN